MNSELGMRVYESIVEEYERARAEHREPLGMYLTQEEYEALRSLSIMRPLTKHLEPKQWESVLGVPIQVLSASDVS